MPTWDGIEDASQTPRKMWFSRVKDNDSWKPLRKCDCRTINERGGDGGSVIVEGGRVTADLENNVLRYNFYNSPVRKLVSATWFLKESKGDKLFPVSEKDAELIEGLYQRAIEASSSLGEGIDKVLKEEVLLEDDQMYKVVIVKSGPILSVKKRPRNNFQAVLSLESPVELQRGYGSYTVEGEEAEIALGPVRHLIFVVHGVGEAMWSREDVNIPSMVDEMDRTRALIHKKQFDSWKKECLKLKPGVPAPQPPSRIELIPVEWYSKIHSDSSTLKSSLISTTLRTIPKLRALANDVVFDVLMYLTPEFCERVLECVTDQIRDLYQSFQLVHDDFIDSGGKCSLLGHSLGSVIVWDMLSILQDNAYSNESRQGAGTEDDPIIAHDTFSSLFKLPTADSSTPTGYQTYAENGDRNDKIRTGTWGPSLRTKMKVTVPFIPVCTFFLGSPLGLFLTLRGAHEVFNELRVVSSKDTEGKRDTSPISPFTLPSGAVYNIFHPSDPVAYRIEPLLLPPKSDDLDLPAPSFLVLDGRGVRLHLKAREISDSLFRGLSGFFSTSVEKLPESVADPAENGKDKTKKPSPTKKRNALLEYKFPLGGKSDRVDFQLQPGVVENEYLSAISAHSSYFINDDLIEFLMQKASIK